MHPWMRKLWPALLLFACLRGAAAQDVDPTEIMRGGLQAIQMIDQAQARELWDGAAAVARKRVGREDFATQIARARAPLGAVRERNWVAINRQVIANADPDLAGQYVSIEYESRFASRPDQRVRELVTFHLDRDQVWRFSGYVVR